MSERLTTYLELEAEVLRVRSGETSGGRNEDTIIDELECVWWELSRDERDWIRARDAIAFKPGR
jgi:hypothetical protein